MKKYSIISLAVFSLAIAFYSSGCSNGTHTRWDGEVVGPATVNGKTIDHTMTDPQILENLGLDITKAQAKKVQGPDGYSTAYEFGEQKVSIVRSLVTGVYVSATGSVVNGNWRLGGGK